uniref:BZIP domain-containing protein n=1 Tax=Kwoniella bestiolae CBS 10118 TaxID=1296100 RepID=A0A1B9FZX9_9TREE|nr:hypothetical protein I302_05778 [Kwoniella bestiolae CBS 10118]OCF24319.1 hypothetical protein I302_05778 [Kwoniella bestiolae CBS 10118]
MFDPRSPTRQSPSAINRRATSPSSSHSSSISRHSPQQSEPLSPDAAYSSAHQYVTNPPAPGGTSSVRRREANRLAAQRFRSRKKGYQDSLEERIRVLESEKEVLVRQVDEGLSRSGHPSSSSLQPRSSHLRQGQADGDGVDGHHWSSKGQSSSSHRSASPERREPPLDAEVRIASLESANRRLQDDVRNLIEENDQLRDELQRWRSWHVEHDRSRRMDMADGHHPRRAHRKGLVDGDSNDRSRRNDMMDGDHVDGSQHGDRVDGHTPHAHHAHLDGNFPDDANSVGLSPDLTFRLWIVH